MLMRRTGAHSRAFRMPARSMSLSTKKTIRMTKLKSRVIVVPRIVPRWMRPMSAQCTAGYQPAGAPATSRRGLVARAPAGGSPALLGSARAFWDDELARRKLHQLGDLALPAARILVHLGIERGMRADPLVLIQVAIAGAEGVGNAGRLQERRGGNAGRHPDMDGLSAWDPMQTGDFF